MSLTVPWLHGHGRQCSDGRSGLMFDLAAIGIAVACFAFSFALVFLLDRI